MVNKRIFILLAFLSFHLGLYAQTFSYTYQGQQLNFRIISSEEKTVAVADNSKKFFKAFNLEIPESVEYRGERFIVNAIDEKAFDGNKQIVRVTLPNTLKSIGVGAFRKCKKLESIKIPEGVINIQQEAFVQCANLTNLLLPSSLKEIGSSAFYNCKNITQLELPEGLESIGEGAFCFTRLEHINIPRSVISIGKMAFMPFVAFAKKNITKSIYIPSTVKNIGEHAFSPGHNGFHWNKTHCTVYSLPDWVTEEIAEKIGIHEDSYNDYKSRYPNGPEEQEHNITQSGATNKQNIENSSSALQPDRELAKKLPEVANSSDVDSNIPISSKRNDDLFAFIIANETYQDEVNVQCALNDGRTFKLYCEKTLGINPKHIFHIENATLGTMKRTLNRISSVSNVYEGNARFIVYYAGHGMPDANTKDAYILPTDGSCKDLSTALSLKELYDNLGDMQARDVTLFLDACFSGAQRGDGMLANARSVAIVPKAQEVRGKMVVFSAATGNETAWPYLEKGHGLFTYFLLKALQETNGEITYGELAEYILKQVKRSIVDIDYVQPQTPNVSASPALRGCWEQMKL